MNRQDYIDRRDKIVHNESGRFPYLSDQLDRLISDILEDIIEADEDMAVTDEMLNEKFHKGVTATEIQIHKSAQDQMNAPMKIRNLQRQSQRNKKRELLDE